jgi:D-alanyl-D-alanine carboxypeptidase
MSILGRHLIYDFPQYYNLFSRRTADAGIAEVANTNRRFLDSYPGADGIKTGYTVAAGYNLVASAERNGVRIIATLFGGTSTADRNARITQLLDMGFAEAPARATVRPPQPAPYAPGSPEAPSPQAPLVAANDNVPPAGANPPAARTIRVSGLVERSLRPLSRPRSAAAQPALPTVSDDVIAGVLAEALGLPAPEGAAPDEAAVALAAAPAAPPPAAPLPAAPLPAAEAPAGAGADTTATPEAAATLVAAAEPPAAEPAPPPPAEIIMTAAAIAPEPRPADPSAIEVVTRLSTSGGHHWGINVGRYPSRDAAERALIQVALAEAAALDGGVRRITQRSGGFDANIMGLTQEGADLACRRLQARGVTCFMIGTE